MRLALSARINEVVNSQRPGRLALVLSLSMAGLAVAYYGALFLMAR